MKYTFLIGLIIIFSSYIFGQKSSDYSEKVHHLELDAFYTWTMTGQNVSVQGSKYMGNHAFSFGLKYHINRPVLDNQNYVYKKRFFEREFPEAIGFNLGYMFEPSDNHVVRPYFYYSLQTSYLRLIRDYTTEYSSQSVVAGMTVLNETSPFFVFENSIGVGLKTRVYKNVYLNQSAGIGMAWLLNVPNSYARYNIEWVTSLKLGISYRFN